MPATKKKKKSPTKAARPTGVPSPLNRWKPAYGLRGLGSSRRHVLAFLLLKYNDALGHACVSNDHMAFACGYCPNTITNCLRDLVGAGVIARNLRDDDPNQSWATYPNWAGIASLQEKYVFADRPTAQKRSRIAERKVPRKPTPTSPRKSLEAQRTEDEATAATLGEPLLFSTSDILALIKDHFGDHETYAAKDATKMMRSCASACIRMAGSEEKCLAVLQSVFTDPAHAAICTYLSTHSRWLGGTIRKLFPKWLAAYDVARKPEASVRTPATDGATDNQDISMIPASMKRIQ